LVTVPETSAIGGIPGPHPIDETIRNKTVSFRSDLIDLDVSKILKDVLIVNEVSRQEWNFVRTS